MSIENKEIELKLQVLDAAQWEAIIEYVKALPNQQHRETIHLAAVYYDTAGAVLRNHKMAYRVRRENDCWVATIKGGGSASNGLHQRMEYNVPVETGQADFQVFDDLPLDEAIKSSLKGQAFIAVLATDFIRQAVTVLYNQSKVEIALDQGVIRAHGKECPILEIELELMAGKQADIIEFGEVLLHKFALARENRSKFARGLALAENVME